MATALLSTVACLPATAADLTAPKQTERRMLGHGTDRPLATSADPQLRKALAELRGKAQTQGKVRVIIGVRAAFAPEGNLSNVEAKAQRDDIANVQRHIHAKLPKQSVDHVTHFEFIPFSALAVDANELDALAAMPEVTDIQEDRLNAPTLAESVPLIRGSGAWAAGYTGGGWTVAVLDSGVDKTHPFLSGKVVSEACYSTTDPVKGSTSVCPGGVSASTAASSGVNCSLGVNGCEHGTHVAGIAAGLGSAFSGVARGANIIAIQLFSRFNDATVCGSGTPCLRNSDSDLNKALQQVYALRGTFNIAAVNLSLGGLRFSSQSACDAAQGSTKATIDLLRSAGIATVIASGNDGSIDSASWPGCISSAILVGATFDAAGYSNDGDGWYGGNSSVDEVAYFSNSASFLDVLAPGADIVSSLPGGTYGRMWGTSQATPHVAGCWTVLKQAKPTATVDQIEQALQNTGVPVTDWRTGLIKPRIDCKAALDSLLGSGTNAPNLTISAFSASPITVSAGGSANLSATVRNAGTESSSATNLRYYEWLNSAWSEMTFCRDNVGALAPGGISSQSCSIIPPSTPAAYKYTVAVDSVPGESDPTDNSAVSYATVTVTTASVANYALSVNRTGTGSGTVTGTGINCGSDCTELYPSGTVVNLTATPSLGTTFTGWSGACTGGSCQVTMTAAKSVTANFTLTPPNLTISSFSAFPTTISVGGSLSLLATVRNAGAGASSATTLRYYYWIGSAWSEIMSCRDSVATLASGATSSQSCVVTARATAGTDYFYVAVDSVSGESVTSDNFADYISIAVTATGTMPDLVVSALTAGSSAQVGGQLQASVAVKNQGSAIAGSSRLRFYLSRDTTISASDINTNWYCDVSSLSPGATNTCAGQITIPSTIPPGTYYLGAIVDADNQISELDENNNTGAATSFTTIASYFSRNYVQKAYIAYYGRPADPAGQDYWALRMDAEGGSLNAIIGAFGNSAEFNRRYGGLTYTQLVTKIYQQTLGRDPDQGGLNYYVGELQAGRRTLQSITLDVLNGATTAPDSTVLANKLDVVEYYTAQVAAGCAYGTDQDGVNSLSGVSAVAATVTAAKASINSRCGP